VGGSRSRWFLSLAWWEASRPARCQALIVEGCTPSRSAISPLLSSPVARSRSAWLGHVDGSGDLVIDSTASGLRAIDLLATQR